MDNSRQLQLIRFKREMDNLHLSPITRKRAASAFYRIKRQLKDKKLAKLRYEYMKADAANDEIGRLNIGDRVSAYMFRTYKKRI